MGKTRPSCFEALPPELIHQVVSELSVIELVSLSKSCHFLRRYCLDENHWQSFIENRIDRKLASPKPFQSFRELYANLHPFWFLPQRKLWFSNAAHTGKLLLARYDHRIGAIEAYSVLAQHEKSSYTPWQYKPEVSIRPFLPKVRLDLNAPVLRINVEAVRNSPGDGSLLQREISMDIYETGHPPTLHSSFSLARSMEMSSGYTSMDVWPPRILPSHSRCRNSSANNFKDPGHRPATLSDLSEHTFRVRKWLKFSSQWRNGLNVRVGEDVSTYASLMEEDYKPTKSKPWRGIWVGDYNIHGPEFLVILQPDSPRTLPSKITRARDGNAIIPSRFASYNSDEDEILEETEVDSSISQNEDRIISNEEENNSTAAETGDNIYSGQMLGVKLTGDPNVPRGEYTFVAEDIGSKGFIRTADDEEFNGARVVKSVGHVAEEVFKYDMYIPTELFLVDFNTIAHYWTGLRSISYYRRVDVEALLRIH